MVFRSQKINNKEQGVATVEFALVATVFLMLLLGIMDWGRMLFIWNAANEATRYGARTAIVCDQVTGKEKVLSNMKQFIPDLTSSNVKIDWYDANNQVSLSCDHTNCSAVNVEIVNLNFNTLSPYMGFLSAAVPKFSTFLPREVMGKDLNSDWVCS